MFPYINPIYSIHYCKDYALLLGDLTNITITNVELFIIEKLDGTLTINDLVSSIMTQFNSTDYESIKKTVNKILKKFSNYILFTDMKEKHLIKTTGIKNTITPLSLSIELTNRCNEKCIHCLKNAGYNSHCDINYLNLINYLDFLKHHTKSIQLTGGEPMLYKDFYNLLSYCKNNFEEISVSTTGTLINESNVENFLDTTTYVSLYSHIESNHDEITLLKGSYNKTLNGIDLLVKNNINVSISSIVTKFNINYIEDMVKLAINHKVNNIRFGQFNPMGRGESLGSEWILNSNEKVKLHQITKSLNEKYKDYIDIVIFPLDSPKKDLCGKNLSCSAGRRLWVIKENGNILPCYFFPDDLFTLGNINDTDVETFVKTIELNSMKNNILVWNDRLNNIGYDISYICDELKNYVPNTTLKLAK